jgi:hypothetical protein
MEFSIGDFINGAGTYQWDLPSAKITIMILIAIGLFVLVNLFDYFRIRTLIGKIKARRVEDTVPVSKLGSRIGLDLRQVFSQAAEGIRRLFVGKHGSVHALHRIKLDFIQRRMGLGIKKYYRLPRGIVLGGIILCLALIVESVHIFFTSYDLSNVEAVRITLDHIIYLSFDFVHLLVLLFVYCVLRISQGKKEKRLIILLDDLVQIWMG